MRWAKACGAGVLTGDKNRGRSATEEDVGCSSES